MPVQLRSQEQFGAWGEGLSAAARLEVVDRFFGLTLVPWQVELFEAVGGAERPKVHHVQISRKAGKTFVLAAFILSELILEADSEIYVFSDSQNNLRAVLWNEMLSWLQLCRFPDMFKLHYDRIVYVPTGGFVRIRASNHQATQGLNPTTVVLDETHLQKNDHVWNGAIMAGAARRSPLLLSVTTPGYDTSSLAHSLYEAVRAETMSGRIYEPPDAATCYRDREQWAVANPGLGHTFEMDSLESDFKLMPEHEFMRFRLGCWTHTAEAWFPYGVWGSLKVDRELQQKEAVWLGFDGSNSGDSTALVACTADGFIQTLGCWEHPGLKEWQVPRHEVEDCVAQAFEDYNVRMLYADPPFWNREIEEWMLRWPKQVEKFPTYTKTKMSPATTAFYVAATTGRLSHSGSAQMARHIANCVIKPSPAGDYVAKPMEHSPAKIDIAIAAVLAHHAMTQTPARPELFIGSF